MSKELIDAFELMGIGMAGIFVALLIIYLASLLLLKVFPEEEQKNG